MRNSNRCTGQAHRGSEAGCPRCLASGRGLPSGLASDSRVTSQVSTISSSGTAAIHRRRVSIPSVAVGEVAPEFFETLTDKRIVLVEGEVTGAINRRPGDGEIRSNLALGGTAEATELTETEREICAALGPELKRRGLVYPYEIVKRLAPPRREAQGDLPPGEFEEHDLAEARARFFSDNGYGDDGGYSERWVKLKLGPLPFAIPNTASRKQAVPLHDLHHILTGYGTDWRGEFEISAWELGAGCGRFSFAWQINLQGALAGLLVSPLRTMRAFRRGLRCRSLYTYEERERLFASTIADARRTLAID